ncbi:signal transduction histidine kinase [Bacilli bacterium PM5-9]|nr:signal transduction histidine kinase [Bacilli bacterium PM5-9]
MRNKVTLRLITYFGISLLIFALLVGSFFIYSYSNYSTNLHYQELEQRATTISKTMASYLSEKNTTQQPRYNGKNNHSQKKVTGYGKYLELLEDIAMADVWVLDKNGNILTKGEHKTPITDKKLPLEADEIVKKVLSGEASSSKSFSGFLGESNITIAQPILEDNKVLGAVLLHSPVHGLTEARNKQTEVIVIVMIIAMAITIPLTILLSYKFVKPLKRMEKVSCQMADGNYDIKTQINSNDEIGQLARSIDILSEKLENASLEQQKMDKMRQTFFSNISHELRTPVTVMRGSLEALVDDVVSDKTKIKEYHIQMLEESIHLQRLVNDLLELSRLQNDDFSIKKEKVNFSDIINEVTRSMFNISNKKNIEIDVQNLPFEISLIGDYGRLRQMLMIIVDNAIKFSFENEVVSIIVTQTKKYFYVSIVDYGIGISDEDLPYIFDRFYKNNEENNEKGIGLGLSIAKAIANKHDIELLAKCENNETSFILQIKK